MKIAPGLPHNDGMTCPPRLCSALAARLTAMTLVCGLTGIDVVQAQVYDLRELNTEQIRALPLDRTVVIMPGGILEEHGPYLPSYTDGYANEEDARQVARAVVARPGWVALMFPSIPLGAGGGNQIGLKSTFAGTYHVHYETLRAVYLDLASELGAAGFRWVFVFHGHGSMAHKLALDQAADFFTETFGGQMVHLGGLSVPPTAARPPVLAADAQRENGLDVHAGLGETSRTLYLRPDLVASLYRQAPPLTGTTWAQLVDIGKAADWPGYFGSPRLATAAIGAELSRRRAQDLSSLVLRILDGFDPRSLPRDVDEQQREAARVEYNALAAKHDERVRAQQQEWLARKGRAWP